MDISIDTSGPIIVAKLSGEFNLGDEQIIAGELQSLVAERGSKLAIDLSGLDQINSMGLSELINVVIRSRLSKSQVVLVNPSAFVRGIFEVTHLATWFEIVDDIDAAAIVMA